MALNKILDDYLAFATRLIEEVISRHSMQIVEHGKSSMGGWFVFVENSEFTFRISLDRSGGYPAVELGSRVRRKPRAHLRGPWSMSHLRGYLNDSKDHFRFKNFEEEKIWFKENEVTIFDSSFLNSDGLNVWAIKASRRQIGQNQYSNSPRNTQPSLRTASSSPPLQ